jgi:hypothetical protein
MWARRGRRKEAEPLPAVRALHLPREDLPERPRSHQVTAAEVVECSRFEAGLRINGAANAPYATHCFEIVPATAPGKVASAEGTPVELDRRLSWGYCACRSRTYPAGQRDLSASGRTSGRGRFMCREATRSYLFVVPFLPVAIKNWFARLATAWRRLLWPGDRARRCEFHFLSVSQQADPVRLPSAKFRGIGEARVRA